MEVVNCIDVSENSRVPKYQQIVDSIIKNISNGNIHLDQKLPSINTLSENFYLSRDTVEKAYNILKDRNIIVSIPRRGNYVSKTEIGNKHNVLFLVNKLSTYKMRIYNSFLNKMGVGAKIDLQIYHCDEFLFLNILKNIKINYDYFIVMPHFKTTNLQHISFTDAALSIVNIIPKEKLLILDNLMPAVSDDISAVYQDFDKDIYDALSQGLDKISKYKKMILVYPTKLIYPYPRRILIGFTRFCTERGLDYEIIEKVYDDIVLKEGDLFVTIEESDLVSLVNQVRVLGLKLGKDIGVISYNDTPLKDLLGITVISTDFKVMGEAAADMVLNNEKGRFKVPFNFIERESL